MEIIDIKILDIKHKKDYIKQCLNIYNYYISNTCFTLETVPLTYQEFSKRINEYSKHSFLLAVQNNKVLGYAYLDQFNKRQGYYPSVDLSIYVDKDYTNKDIGSKLVDKIEEKALLKGYENIISIITSVNTNSINFHIKHQFKECGYLDNIARKFDTDLGVYYYKKRLIK